MLDIKEKSGRRTRRNSLLAQIGNTPLLRIDADALRWSGTELYAKAEWLNPGGSVKDRPALKMIQAAIQSGELSPDKTIIDATSGNTGIACAMIARILGYRVALALPENASPERKQILQAYGADIIYTDPLEGTDGAQDKVKVTVAARPDKYHYLDQYNNPANWRAHYEGTANEIWQQTRGRITHFIAGLGTTGTFTGVTRRLKELNPDIQCISVQPDTPLHGLEGLKHLPTANVPGIYDATLADENLEVSTEESFQMVRWLMKEHGLFVGFSSGAVMAAVLKKAGDITSGVVVTIFPDGGAKYLNHDLWKNRS